MVWQIVLNLVQQDLCWLFNQKCLECVDMMCIYIDDVLLVKVLDVLICVLEKEVQDEGVIVQSFEDCVLNILIIYLEWVLLDEISNNVVLCIQFVEQEKQFVEFEV